MSSGQKKDAMFMLKISIYSKLEGPEIDIRLAG
jgi:hypothetical protein